MRSATAKLATSSSAKGCTFEYDKDKFIVHADVCHAGVTVHTPPPAVRVLLLLFCSLVKPYNNQLHRLVSLI